MLKFITYCSHATNRSDNFKEYSEPPKRKVFYALFVDGASGHMFTIKLTHSITLGQLHESVVGLVVQNNEAEMTTETKLFELDRQFV